MRGEGKKKKEKRKQKEKQRQENGMEERPHRETKKVARVERFAHAARATGGAVVFVNARENVTSSSSSGKKKINNTKK